MSLVIAERTEQWKLHHLEKDKKNKADPSIERRDRKQVSTAGEEVVLVKQWLLGESAPRPVPLSASEDQHPYWHRYDWMLAISGVGESWWDWMKRLGRDPALKCQLHIRQGEASAFTEVSSGLVALAPSRNQPSALERVRDRMLAPPEATEKLPWIGVGAAVAAPLVANLIPSPTNWWIYRCLDPWTHDLIIEWNITRKVLQEYGPALRGSLALTFHGAPPRGVVRFRPGFCYREDPLDQHAIPSYTDGLLEIVLAPERA